ncbi:MAG: histidinol-phosphatase HisJ family protein [Thermaerobacterales bacterium]
MITDHHMHLEHDAVVGPCRYDAARISEYAAAARRRGVDQIGISEHCHRFVEFRPIMASLTEPVPAIGGDWLLPHFNHHLDDYVQGVIEAQRQGLPVLLGLEADFLPGCETAVRAVLEKYPWDYVLGSVHFLTRPGGRAWAIDSDPGAGWPDTDVDEAYRSYFATLQGAAASGLFDIMAHPDLIKKFGHRPSFDPQSLYDETAAVFKQSGVAAELSTAGWHRPVMEAYPAPGFLRALAKAEVPITLGSDAHEPGEVGLDFDRALVLARQCGHREPVFFKNRARQSGQR